MAKYYKRMRIKNGIEEISRTDLSKLDYSLQLVLIMLDIFIVLFDLLLQFSFLCDKLTQLL